ncbi:DNA polymerase III subunit beta [Candidatus Saganbacteria bacterium CG08_land_8_20_14_0_20_45_16]|uniref:Beta sliding clamp n=1 Tax=Candidatus Saganbacteria bacterium CG08_land_8_20_14_0_20_45_16 TaxID=2014293 RepID=A0A2H0XY08_UNCSA|nr:MAG: DNA polymerase III subunit beta [Candidatus Saganbacteria bacterium CG08_land_8_20_14_0_20_45_16]
MEFTCEKKYLQSGVSSVEKIVTTRSTLPIIGYLLLEAKKNGVKLSANNLEIGIELALNSKVEKEGAILVPAKTIAGIVAKLPDTKVSFKLNEKGLINIAFGRSNFNVHTLPADEFPVLPKIKADKSFSLSAKLFAAMIKQTIFSVSSSDDKHVLTGVLLEFGKSGRAGDSANFRMIATDGYRLAKRGEVIELADEIKGSIIVPAKALQEIARIIELDKEEAEIVITFSADQIAFSFKDVYLVSRIIQGQFPDYRQVLPKKGVTKVLVSRKALLDSAERATVIASGSANVVRFDLKENKLHLFASTPDIGTVDEIIDAEVTGQNKVQVAFNIRLVTDVLKVLENEKVIIELSESLGPGLIRGDTEGQYLYIVMPIRTQEAA